MPDPIALAVPSFFLLIAIEYAWAKRRGVVVYRFTDAVTDLTLLFPEATCRSVATSTVRSDAETYRLTIEVVVTEDGVERWRRSWERTFPRDDQ